MRFRPGNLLNIAMAVMAGAFIALAVHFFLPRADHARERAPKENRKAFFARTPPGVAQGATLALVCRNTPSPCIRSLAAAALAAAGAGPDSGSNFRRFLDESGVAGASFRWAVFSVGAVDADDAGELKSMPEFSLAASFTHDPDRILAAYERTKKEDSPLSFSPAEISGEPVWRIRTAEFDGLLGEESLPCAASLSGELLLVGSTEAALARQIDLYRDGLGEDKYFARLSRDENALRLFIPDFGSVASAVASAAAVDLSMLDSIMPDGAAKFRDLKEFDFIAAADKSDSLSVSLALRAANSADASDIAVVLKAFLLRFAAVFKADPSRGGENIPSMLAGLVPDANVASKDEYVKITIPLPPEIAAGVSAALTEAWTL